MVLDLEGGVNSIWDLYSSGHAQPCPQTLVSKGSSVPLTRVHDTTHCQRRQRVMTVFVTLGGGDEMGPAPRAGPHATVATPELAIRY